MSQTTRKSTNGSSHLTQTASMQVREWLKAKGIISHDPQFSAIVSQFLLGEDSKEWQHLLATQGPDFSNWTEFAEGASTQNQERFKHGQLVSHEVFIASCKAVEHLTGQSFNPEEVAAIDPAPYFDELHTAMLRRIQQAKENLLSGICINDLEAGTYA